MMYTAVIIEDEAPARVTLKSYLRRYFEDILITAEIDNVKDSVSYLNTNPVDILFLDVQLKDGKGIEILNQINSDQYRIIFTTAYEEYTLEAFKHKSFGYLLKPLDPNDFKEIVGRVTKDLETKEPDLVNKRIRIPSSTGYKWIDLKNIIRCESESNYTKIMMAHNNKVYTISKTLKHVETVLINSDHFFRVHQSHLVNMRYIKTPAIVKNSITMTNGDVIPISRAKKAEFNERI